jgi:glycogen(starch) synthase
LILPAATDLLPSRVLMTADAVGGVWRYSVDLAHALSRSGIEVILAVMGPPPTLAQVCEVGSNGIVLVQGPFDLEWMPGADDDVERAAAWLMELDAAYAPDVVHLNGYGHAALPFRVPVIVVAHSCVLSWWRAVKGEDAPTEWDRYRRRTSAGLRAADLVIAPSATFLRTVETIYGPLARTRVIWNGRDAPTGTVEKRDIVFAAGRLWDEAKNVQLLVDVAPRLSWPVCIAGAGAAGHETSDDVRWLGQLPPADMDAWYAQASIFALPARYEPFGLAALEAALSGCALVLGDIDTLRELWDEAAVFVSPDDGDQLAATLEALAHDPHRRAALGHAARRRAANCPVARMVDAYLDAYRSVLGARGAAVSALAS